MEKHARSKRRRREEVKGATFSLFTTTTRSTAEKDTEEVEERLNERRGGEKGSIAFTQFYMRKSRKEESEEVLEEVSCEKKLGGDGGGEIMEL